MRLTLTGLFVLAVFLVATYGPVMADCASYADLGCCLTGSCAVTP